MSLERWSELLVSAALARIQKKQAVADEDFAAAGKLKKQEAELNAQLEEARQAASGSGGDAIAEEKARLEEAKKRAVAEENFAEAGKLKKRIKVLDENGAGDGDAEKRAWSLALEMAAADATNGAAIAGDLKAKAPVGALDAAPVAAVPVVAAKPAAAGGGLTAAQLRNKEAEIQRRRQQEQSAAVATSAPVAVKQEAPLVSPIPGVSVEQLLSMPNQDIWQKAWEVTWQREDEAGKSGDQKYVYAQAQKVWKQWLAERDRLGKQQAEAEGRQKAAEILKQTTGGETRVKNEASTVPAQRSSVTEHADDSALSKEQRDAQEQQWQTDKAAEADWQRATTEAERRRKAKDGTEAKTGRDLCALVKLRCPADQPLQFERLLAVCPLKTTVKQLIQAMAKEPQEFRQNYDGSEFCVRPVNSRAADWMPVQSGTTPPGFRDDAFLPESMLNVAKTIFEERLRPQANAGEDPLAQFLSQPGRVAPDTPIGFPELLKHCPPGTQPMDLIRSMSKRRDVFRQDASGAFFCVRPRAKCKDWAAVNPYVDVATLFAAGAAGKKPAAAAAKPMSSAPCEGEY